MARNVELRNVEVTEDVALDGRVRRGERNRIAILDALLSLLEDGDPQPAAKDIATRAGVSVRSVFQHFADLETLYAAVVERQTERLQEFAIDVDAGAPFGERLDAFVAQRARLYERVTPVRRAGLVAAETSPTLQQALADIAAQHAREVAQVFAPELASSPVRADARAAVTLATSWEAWDRLRRTQRLSAAAARRAVATLVEGVLAPRRRSR
jgi:AcrR family transcriptional regulator